MPESNDQNIADVAQALPSMPQASNTGNPAGTVVSSNGTVITLGEQGGNNSINISQK